MRFLLEGQARAGVLVHVLSLDAPGEPVMARTDDRGEVLLTLPAEVGSRCVVFAVHGLAAGAVASLAAVPQAADLDPDTEADWESLWASLTLPLSPAEDPADRRCVLPALVAPGAP